MAGTAGSGLGFERDAGGADVVGIEPADLVVPDLADIGGARAEIGDADNGVGRRAPGHFGGRAHVAVDRRGARLVDQRHAALGHAVAAEKALIGLHQHVENRIADPEHVVFCVSHLTVLFAGTHERPGPIMTGVRREPINSDWPADIRLEALYGREAGRCSRPALCPLTDSCTAAKRISFDHLVGGKRDRLRTTQAELCFRNPG